MRVSFLVPSILFLFATSAASAATVVLKTGEILNGDIVEMVNGERVTVRLPGGALRSIPWDQVFTFKATESQPPLAPPSPAPPSAPAIDVAPPSAARHAITFGARASAVFPQGELVSNLESGDLIRPGPALQLDIGGRFSHSWTFFGSYEYASLEKGSKIATLAPASHAAAFGLRAVTAPHKPAGFLFEIGAGWRWLTFTSGNNKSVAGGPILVRTALGLSIAVSTKTRVDLTYGMSIGMLTSFDFANGCVNRSGTCDTIADDDRTVHTMHTLSLGSRFDM
jgi:hypothetical protein